MAEIAIYQDSKGRGTCRSCGAPIEWAETLRGKRMPFDAPILVLRTQGSVLEERGVVEFVDGDRNHFVTCPQAKQWSRR